MNRIQTFRKDAEYFVEAEALTLSPNFVFSDFSLKHSEHTLEFKWRSVQSKNVCSISFNACEDYPDNCFISWCWDKTGEQQCSVCTDRLPELLPAFGEDLLRKELNICNQKIGGDGECKNPCEADLTELNCSQRSSAMSDIVEGRPSKGNSAGERTPTPSDQTMTDVDSDSAADSDEPYNTCDDEDEEGEEEEEDAADYYNYDPADLYRNKDDYAEAQGVSECQDDDQHLSSVHPLLKQDIELFKEVFGDVVKNSSSPLEAQATTSVAGGEDEGGCTHDKPYLTTRYLEALEEFDCDIHIPLKCVDLSPQMADAWGLQLDEPLVLRINFSSKGYLNHREPPKVDVIQKKMRACSIKPQLKNIMKMFLQEIWPTVDNDVLKSKLMKSQSMPCDLSEFAGPVSRDKEDTTEEAQRPSRKRKRRETRAMGEDGVNKASLEHLLEMGFGETESRSALMLTCNNLAEASILLSSMDSCAENNSGTAASTSLGGVVKRPPKLGAIKAAAAKAEKSQNGNGGEGSKQHKLTKRHLSTPVMKREKKKESRAVRSMSTSHTEPDMFVSEGRPSHLLLDPKMMHNSIKTMPPLDNGFLVMLYKYLVQRMPFVNEFCVICDNLHVFTSGAMLMPSVCSRELCLFSFQSLGVMSDTMADIATGADVVDLLITLAKAACFSNRRAKIFMPFPNIVDPDNPEPGKMVISEKEKDFAAVQALLNLLPPMKSLVGTSSSNLSNMLQQKNRLLYPLLNWIIYSNRSHIVKLRKEQQLRMMATPHQFILLSSPPSQERIFQAAKHKYGSVFAFHGSMIENWHSIIRQGLMVATGTNLQMNGAAYGNGIYLSPTASMSANYAGMGYGRHRVNRNTAASADKTGNRFLQGKNVCCMALCEVINSSDLKKCSRDIWVCTNEHHVCTRFFFVYEDGQVNYNDVDMNNPKQFAMVQDALAATFMAVVPKTAPLAKPSTVEAATL